MKVLFTLLLLSLANSLEVIINEPYKDVQIFLNFEYIGYLHNHSQIYTQTPATLSFSSLTHQFPLFRLEPNDQLYPLTPGIEWETALDPLPQPLVLIGKPKEYFSQKSDFSIMSLLMNPMFLMMSLSLGMMFLMPKMMENMDPEAMKEMQDAQKEMREQGGLLGMFSKMVPTVEESKAVQKKKQK